MNILGKRWTASSVFAVTVIIGMVYGLSGGSFEMGGNRAVAQPAAAQPATPAPDTTVYEMRTYTTHPGKLPDLNKRFRDHTMKLFEKHGMRNIIYWIPADQPNTLIYILAHKSREAAAKSFADFRNDPEWKAALTESHKNGEIVKEVKSTFMSTTDYSPLRWAELDKALPKKQPAAK